MINKINKLFSIALTMKLSSVYTKAMRHLELIIAKTHVRGQGR